MERNDTQYRKWLEFIGDVLHQPARSPHFEEQLLSLLTESFFGACCTRNQVQHHWDNRIINCWPAGYIPEKPPGDFDFRNQPLLRWHAVTRITDPQSIGRVPAAIANAGIKREWDELARPWNVNHQLSIPLQLGSKDLHSYLVQRPDDFSEQEFDLARLLQPVLTGLTRYLALALISAAASRQNAEQELTLREMAILTLLSKGLTAESLARRLGISSRTAEKHLEHIYRKLDVRDRLMAVQRAYQFGLLEPPEDAVGGWHDSMRLES